MASRAMASILGPLPAARRSTASRLRLLEASDQGVSKGDLLRLADNLALSVPQMAELLPVSARTIQRYKRAQRFDRVVSEQILHIAQAAARGAQVFGGRDRFLLWLKAPCAALGNRAPVTLMASRFGVEMILDELGRLEHGIVS